MKIGYCVEGSADRAILHGLRDRWCPEAELLEGRFRGQVPRNQIAKECEILAYKGADLIVFLRDANLESWRSALRADEARCPAEYRHRVVFGVCDRNAECWLITDPGYLAAQLGPFPNALRAEDPSPAVKAAFGMTGFNREEQEPQVAQFVAAAPLHQWLKNKSFENFYEQLWHKSKELRCPNMENLRERHP